MQQNIQLAKNNFLKTNLSKFIFFSDVHPANIETVLSQLSPYRLEKSTSSSAVKF